MIPDALNLILLVAGASILPLLAVVATSFVKLSIVFMLVRNALGVQQIPPNIALNALALILSGYIMTPVIYETLDIFATSKFDTSSAAGLKASLEAGSAPLRRFLAAHASDQERQFFLEAARTLWPREIAEKVTSDHIAIVLPAFTVSEMRQAFEIGFLLYLPFIAIDLIVSNILLALGMMMVSPLTISLPFKLFLFVMVDGWSKLILGIVKTYAK